MIQVVGELGVTLMLGRSETFQNVHVAVSVMGTGVQDGRLLDWTALQGAIQKTFEGKRLPTVDFDGESLEATPETLAMAIWEGAEDFLRAPEPAPSRACTSVQVTLGGFTAIYAPTEAP